MCQVYLKKNKNGKQEWQYYEIKQTLGQRKLSRDINNEKKVNPPREHSNRVCTKQWNYKICEAKTYRTERRKKQT